MPCHVKGFEILILKDFPKWPFQSGKSEFFPKTLGTHKFQKFKSHIAKPSSDWTGVLFASARDTVFVNKKWYVNPASYFVSGKTKM